MTRDILNSPFHTSHVDALNMRIVQLETALCAVIETLAPTIGGTEPSDRRPIVAAIKAATDALVKGGEA